MEMYLSKNVDVNSEGSRDWIEEHVVMLGHVNGGLHFLTMNYFAGNPRLSVIVNPVLSTGSSRFWSGSGTVKRVCQRFNFRMLETFEYLVG